MGWLFRVTSVFRGGRRLRRGRRVGQEGRAVSLRSMPTHQNRCMGHPVLWLVRRPVLWVGGPGLCGVVRGGGGGGEKWCVLAFALVVQGGWAQAPVERRPPPPPPGAQAPKDEDNVQDVPV